MIDRFTDRVALITGASRGIGLAIAARLIAEGARVVLTARKDDALQDAVAGLGDRLVEGRALGIAGRADDPEHRAAVLDAIRERYGRLDHLVNNAGINPAYGPLGEVDTGAARKILDVNVIAALEWTREAVAAGLGRPDGPGASVVNIASMAGLRASPGIGLYGVSKAALISLTQQLAHELAPSIRVNAVAPAVVKTTFARALYEGHEEQAAARYPLARLGEPDDVAGPVAFLLSSDAAWITGQTLVIDGGGSLQAVL